MRRSPIMVSLSPSGRGGGHGHGGERALDGKRGATSDDQYPGHGRAVYAVHPDRGSWELGWFSGRFSMAPDTSRYLGTEALHCHGPFRCSCRLGDACVFV